jgi:hypothetical protein
MNFATWQPSMEISMNPTIDGLLAGVVHHLALQRPNQAKLFTTLFGYALINSIFIVLSLGGKEGLKILGISHVLKNLLIFNTVYVEYPGDNANSRNRLHFF